MGFLPPEDRRYLDNKGINFEEIEDAHQKGVVLRDYPLPIGRFDAEVVDILILLPPGYPDMKPDMFHTLPWERLASSNQYPCRADHPILFAGQQWQRWSRHNSQWRAGIDGIHTMLKRIEHALQVAA